MYDVIGIIYEPGVYGDMDPETGLLEVITPPVPLEGWHVNTVPEVMTARPELEEYQVTPSHLRRVWAGDDPLAPVNTIALKFDSEAEANAVLFPPEVAPE